MSKRIGHHGEMTPKRISRAEVIPPGAWRTADGTLIPMSDLERGHLLNCIAMLERKARGWKLNEVTDATAASCCLHGEMASYYAAQDIDRVWEMDEVEWLCRRMPVYVELRQEAARRGLLPFDEAEKYCAEDLMEELGLRWV